MKRHFRYIRLYALLLLLFASPVLGAEGVDTKAPAVPAHHHTGAAGERVAILPFHDYAGSQMKYLSAYIPELLRARLPRGSRIHSVDEKTVRDAMKSQGADADALSQPEIALSVLRESGADIGFAGRYIVQGKTIQIDYQILYTGSGEVVKGPPFRGTVDDGLLDTMERFADRSVEWFRVQAFSDLAPIVGSGHFRGIMGVFDWLAHSRLGPLVANKWVASLSIFLLFLLISFAAGFLADRLLRRLTAKTATTLDDELLAASVRPVKLIIVLFGVRLAVLPLRASASLALFIGNFITACMIAVAAYYLLRVAETFIRLWGQGVTGKADSRIDDDLVPLFSRIIKIFIVIVALLLVLSKFGVEIGPLVASLGIIGFAVGFAVKDTLSNVIGGIILILDNSFSVGDKVSIEGDTGIIIEVGLRNTKLLTYDNEVIVIPNGELMNKKFKNYALPDPKIRVVVEFGVAYGTDPARVVDVVLGAVTALADVEKEPEPVVVFEKMGDWAMEFRAKFWIPMYDDHYMKKIEATTAIYTALNGAGIEIPFPTRTVFMKRESGGTPES